MPRMRFGCRRGFGTSCFGVGTGALGSVGVPAGVCGGDCGFCAALGCWFCEFVDVCWGKEPVAHKRSARPGTTMDRKNCLQKGKKNNDCDEGLDGRARGKTCLSRCERWRRTDRGGRSTRRPCYPSSDSGWIAMFFSPAAFFSQYLRIQASKVLPAALSRPVNASAAISA